MSYDFENARVLIVDDMYPMAALISSILNVFGFSNIYIAHNGAEAYELVCKHDPDIVLTDWFMEPMDGLQLIQMIRSNPRSPNPYVPVIMMTGFSSRMRVETARDSGVTEFLLKPFSASELVARLEHIIERPRQFVKTKQFFGPDRRRKKADGFSDLKRTDDAKKKARAREENEVAEILKKLRGDVEES